MIRWPLPMLVARFLSKANYGREDREKIFFRNAVRFLGLGKDDGEKSTRGRLEKFYRPEERAWLTVFDEVDIWAGKDDPPQIQPKPPECE